MKTLTPEKAILKFLLLPFMLIAISLGAVSSANAQSKSKSAYVFAPEAAAADVEQCQNGPASAPVGCTLGGEWAGGNSGDSKSHWVEGQSIPDRIIMTGLTPGAGQTIQFDWDTTKSGKHALDYLTSFNRSLASADPCAGIAGCGSPSTFPIPTDPNLAPVVPAPGNFTMYNGVITGVSAYTLSGLYSGNSTTDITVTFTANSSTVVLAFGMHIARRADWGLGFSAIDISGSPFHTGLVTLNGSSTGTRAVSLTAGAAVFPALLKITEDFVGGTGNSSQDLQFSASANASPISFYLDDDADGTLSNFQIVGNSGLTPDLVGNIVNFGAANQITVQQINVSFPFFLQGGSCVEDPGGAPQTDNSTFSVASKTATIIAEEGEIINCTFSNNVVLAASANLSGRVLTSDGSGISNARIVLTDLATGQSVVTSTGTFGYYHFEGISVGAIYTATVSHRRYTFLNNTATFSLSGDLSDANFVAAPGE